MLKQVIAATPRADRPHEQGVVAQRRSLALTFLLTLGLVLSQVSSAVARDHLAPLRACISGFHASYWNEQWSTASLGAPGQTITGWIQLVNTGCSTWTKGTSTEARLGTWSPEPGQDQNSPLCADGLSGWLVVNGHAYCSRIQMADNFVAYNSIGNFNFTLKAPDLCSPAGCSGLYTLHLRPVIDGTTWMEDLGLWVQLKVGSYWGVSNTAFNKPNGTPMMTPQGTCYYCVPSATSAWISYVYVRNTGADTTQPNSQSDLWNTEFNTLTHTYGGAETSWTTVSCGSYYRRLANDSKDDGVDPYGAAWGIYDRTPAGYYYHMNTYTNADSATRGVAYKLASYDEPVAVLFDRGGHYVLATAVDANLNPNLYRYQTTISNVYVRDPWVSQASQLIKYANTGGGWLSHFNQYGWNGQAPTVTHPADCPGNCHDDARNGYGTYYVNTSTPTLWWTKWVTVERDPGTTNPDTANIN